MRETVRTDGTVTSVLDFIYDESGKPFAMVDQLSAQPKTYYYVLNLQGDVVKLVDVSGAEVASCEYDAWGNVLSQSGSMASTNPCATAGITTIPKPDSITSNPATTTPQPDGLSMRMFTQAPVKVSLARICSHTAE